MGGRLMGAGVPGGTFSGGLQRNGAEVASCCNTPIHRWGALAIRPGSPRREHHGIHYRVSGWLGRLSVGRKLMLIYLLNLLTAVIYVSSILIPREVPGDRLHAQGSGGHDLCGCGARRADGAVSGRVAAAAAGGRCAHPAGGRARGPRRATAPPMLPSGLAWRCGSWRGCPGLAHRRSRRRSPGSATSCCAGA